MTIHDLAGRIPELRDRELSAEPLPGGLTNRSYLLEGDFGRWVLRINGTAPGIDREREARVLDTVEAAGLGPEIVTNNPDEGYLIYRYIEGQAWTAGHARSAEAQALIGKWLKQLHRLPADLPPVDAVGALRSYLGELPDSAADPLRARLEAIDEAVLEPREVVPCHLDLIAGNIIDNDRGIRLLDWEYAGLSAAELDIAFYLVYQDLSADDACPLLRAYTGDAARAWVRRVEPFRELAELLDSAWRRLQVRRSRRPE